MRGIARAGGDHPGDAAGAVHAVAVAGIIRTPWRWSRDDAIADALDGGLATRRGATLWWDAAATLITDHVDPDDLPVMVLSLADLGT